jgi:predicted transcriptional regulator YdeE
MNIEKTELIGLALPFKTTNENWQSATDCGNLWEQFKDEECVAKIPGRLSDDVIAVYHSYDGDHTNPYSYFIGCRVMPGTSVPEGMDRFVIPAGSYEKRTAKGEIPDCIGRAWMDIWNSGIKRAYQVDFEVYDARSADWANGEVDIYLSVPE